MSDNADIRISASMRIGKYIRMAIPNPDDPLSRSLARDEFLCRYYGPPEPLMKKERKPVPVVEEAPYEGPTIFDKVFDCCDGDCFRRNIFLLNPKGNLHLELFLGFQNQEERQEFNGGERRGGGGGLEKAKGWFVFSQLKSPDQYPGWSSQAKSVFDQLECQLSTFLGGTGFDINLRNNNVVFLFPPRVYPICHPIAMFFIRVGVAG